MKELMKQEN